MKKDKLMNAIGEIDEKFVEEAVPAKKSHKKTYAYKIAAAFAVVVAVAIGFSFTSPGAAAVEKVKGLIESLFPPKDVVVNIEGESEVHTNEADGQEPSTDDKGLKTPGFAIYYDKEMYEMVKEDDITYIRFITDDDDDLPPREMKIEHIDSSVKDTAKSERQQMLKEWADVSETSKIDDMDGVCLSFNNGTNWDSVCGDVYFINDGNGGCFKITVSYFVEAAEGHGSRFAQMLRTFEIVEP